MVSHEVIPPIEIDENNIEVVGINTCYDGMVSICRHTQPKNRPSGFQPKDFTSITISVKQIDHLIGALKRIK